MPLGLIPALVLASCSIYPPTLHVVPAGSLQHGVVFYMQDPLRRVPSQFQVANVGVVEEYADGTSTQLWSAFGPALLHVIRYGVPENGLRTIHPAPPLRRGHKYSVDVGTTTGIEPFRIVSFWIDANGHVRPEQR